MMIPKLTTLSKWAVSLIVDFPEDNIPILTDENEWKNWGNLLVQETSFADNGAPATTQFSDWNAWANKVFGAMANF